MSEKIFMEIFTPLYESARKYSSLLPEEASNFMWILLNRKKEKDRAFVREACEILGIRHSYSAIREFMERAHDEYAMKIAVLLKEVNDFIAAHPKQLQYIHKLHDGSLIIPVPPSFTPVDIIIPRSNSASTYQFWYQVPKRHRYQILLRACATEKTFETMEGK